GVFPLNGVVLMPAGRLPLNVFEPRYLALVLDSLKDKRLIGMIQPREPEKALTNPSLYSVGTVGRISAFSESEDGRMMISLTGVCRFRLGEEQAPLHGYRRCAVDCAPFLPDFDIAQHSDLDRDHLMKVLNAYVRKEEVDLNIDLLAGFSDPALVAALAMILPFAPREKQALLEAFTVAERGGMLTALMEMDNISHGGVGSPGCQ
ncbi:MAG: hypothetical protein A2516_04110, partial [Alphaproteobacteria bacterium RIFOXYD12_FULL_60_8]